MKTMSDDSAAIALLCTTIAQPAESDSAPLSVTEWNRIEAAITASELPGPAGLIGLAEAQIVDVLGIDAGLANRIACLFARDAEFRAIVTQLSDHGFWVLTRIDPGFPAKLKTRLETKCPPVLFGTGDSRLTESPAVAIVGSRDVSPSGQQYAQAAGERCATSGLTVVSGAARGVDRLAMSACLEAGGQAVGVVADNLARFAGEPETRRALEDGCLCLLSPFHPSAPFNTGNAMSRNKSIYALSEYAIVVDSAYETGGTWAGAIENLRSRWVPLFVRSDPDSAPGNRHLISRGGISLASAELSGDSTLTSLLSAKIADGHSSATPSDREVTDGDISVKLAKFLMNPRSLAEIAIHLNLTETDARKMLKNEVEARRIVRIKQRELRYQCTRAAGSGNLFDSDTE